MTGATSWWLETAPRTPYMILLREGKYQLRCDARTSALSWDDDELVGTFDTLEAAQVALLMQA